MEIQYTPEERIIITSIANFSVQLSLWYEDFYKTDEFKKILNNNPDIHGDFIFYILKNSGLLNEGALPTILYSLLVYPREAIKKGNYQAYDAEVANINLKMKLEGLTTIDSENKYKITVVRNDYKTTKDMLRHIRNAVSHGRVNLCGSNFVFTDITPYEKKKTIIFEIPKNEIGSLIQDLYNALLLIIKDIQTRYSSDPIK